MTMPFPSLSAAALLLLSASAEAKVREAFEQVVAFNPGGSFRIENGNGSIEIRTWDEPRVRIEAEKEARTEEGLRSLEIAIEGGGDSVSVRTVHHRRRDHGSVSYRILLPAEAEVAASTANGEVNVRGIQGRVEVQSVNGAVTVEDITGSIEAETTNGAIRASYQSVAQGPQRFETTNGSVRVYLPADAGGELEAETVNGSIEVDFPMTLTRSSRRRISGSFGGGGSRFDVSTVNGSVKILQN